MSVEPSPLNSDEAVGFTPGPWSAGHPNHWIWAPSERGGQFHLAEVRGWGYFTGRGDGALGLSALEATARQNANARLIAAAPELYAALVMAREVCRAGARPTEAELAIIGSALAKARPSADQGTGRLGNK